MHTGDTRSLNPGHLDHPMIVKPIEKSKEYQEEESVYSSKSSATTCPCPWTGVLQLENSWLRHVSALGLDFVQIAAKSIPTATPMSTTTNPTAAMMNRICHSRQTIDQNVSGLHSSSSTGSEVDGEVWTCWSSSCSDARRLRRLNRPTRENSGVRRTKTMIPTIQRKRRPQPFNSRQMLYMSGLVISRFSLPELHRSHGFCRPGARPR